MNELLAFKPSDSLSLGVEVELQVVDPLTWDLKPIAPDLLAKFGEKHPHIKPEIFQSMLEVNTRICHDANEVEKDLEHTLEQVQEHSGPLGFRLAATGTHPSAHYVERIVSESSRYLELMDRNQWIAQRMSIFGLHVHVGMHSGDHCIAMTHQFLHVLHVLLALSASSPFWHGHDTGLASCRITIFESLPTAGRPIIVNSWKEFQDLYQSLIASDSIRSMKDLWWDFRPSPSYGTLEIRICDGLATLRETAAMVALIHALAVYFDRQLQEGKGLPPPPNWMIRENKWRASRHGLDAKVIVNEKGKTMALKTQINEILAALKGIERDYNYTEKFQTLRRLVETGGSYTRQRQIFSQTGSLREVTRANTKEFETNEPF